MVRGMAIRQITPADAARDLAATPGAVYLDVRTPEEFDAGHPAGARNVPVLLLDPATRRPRPNPEFLAVVQRHLAPGTMLLVGCQSGMRSQRACELLADAGYTDLANVRGGFGGSEDAAGWQESALPVERGAAGRLS
ncbi:MAG TPA: rhodanese-like domain-containing protein [Candidatus Binatia bacterium]|nr:rhodanese-like domain-containing protein [Candidatus Binatia bacterium]